MAKEKDEEIPRMVITRTLLQDLANIRFAEAKLLLDNEMYDGAYYLSGYVIELALKACFTKNNVHVDEFPDKTIVKHIFTHSLSDLKGLASMTVAFNDEIKINPQLDVNWSEYVIKWTEESRYKRIDKETAVRMFDAISNTDGGVFVWLKKHW